MSEATEAAPKKKGGKMPMMIAVVLMLAGGGFFMMKGKGAKKEVPKVMLGEAEVVMPDEFVVNLADGKTYVRAKIGLRPKKDYKPEEITKHDAEISDAINVILKTTKPEETVSEAQINKLKARIAKAVNKILIESDAHGEADDSHDKDKKKKKKKKKSHDDEEETSHSSKDHDSEEDEDEEEEIPEGWDSAEGPVLKVFFKSFATQ